MSLMLQAQRLGFTVAGKLTPVEGRDSHLIQRNQAVRTMGICRST